MKNSETTDWNSMLVMDSHVNAMIEFAFNEGCVSRTTDVLSKTQQSKTARPEFRKLVNANGATYARRLARKALRYRGLIEE